MENEKENSEKSTLTDEIANIGQIIVGELESIGASLPPTRMPVPKAIYAPMKRSSGRKSPTI